MQPRRCHHPLALYTAVLRALFFSLELSHPTSPLSHNQILSGGPLPTPQSILTTGPFLYSRLQHPSPNSPRAHQSPHPHGSALTSPTPSISYPTATSRAAPTPHRPIPNKANNIPGNKTFTRAPSATLQRSFTPELLEGSRPWHQRREEWTRS